LLFVTEISEEMWTDVPQNGEDLSYMFDGETETTPVKACGDLAYNVNNGGKISDLAYNVNNGGKISQFFGIQFLFTLYFDVCNLIN